MRQAGRSLPEYRLLRQKHSLLDLCHRPELAAQVTLQPVERLGVDAAILFADILLPFEPLGLGLTFAAGEGPQITRPIRQAGQVLDLPPVDPATDLAYVLAAASGVPVIHFGTDTAGLLADFARAGGDVIGVDWRIPLDVAWERIAPASIQGNLDPVALLAPRAELERQTRQVLARAGSRPGHVFNLGHGVLPETPVEALQAGGGGGHGGGGGDRRPAAPGGPGG